MGKIVKYTLSDGNTFRAYVPDSVTDDTPILYYSYLLGQPYEKDKIWQGYETALLEQNPSSIVIIPSDQTLVVGNSNVESHIFQNNAMEAIEILENEYNVELNQMINGGFSAGFGYAVRTSAHYIEQTGTTDRQVLVAVDGFMNDSTNILKSELQTLADNDAIIVSYSQQQNLSIQANKLSSTGLGILYIVDPTIPVNLTKETGYWGYHDYMTTSFMDTGLYQKIIDFVNGEGELPEGYTYRYYDPKTGQIIDIDSNNAAEILGIEKMPSDVKFGEISELLSDYTIKADNKLFAQYLNSIKNEIVASSVLSTTFEYSDYTSTTNIPSSFTGTLNSYYNSTADLLTKLANDILEFSKISDKVNDLNKQQASEAENLNNQESSPSSPINETINYYGTKTEESPSSWATTSSPSSPNLSGASSSSSSSNFLNNNTTENTPSNIYSNANYTEETGSKSDGTTNKNEILTTGNIVEDFPEYEELYSDNEKIVLEYLNENEDSKYKVIIHKDGNNITGIEHYYHFDTTTDAVNEMNSIKEQYGEHEYYDQIIQKDNYIKIIFKETMYQNMTIDKVVEKYYSEFDKVVAKEK